MDKTLTATFKHRADAELAVTQLEQAGFPRSDISMLISDASRNKHFNIDEASKAPEGIATGGVVGGILGAVAASLVAVGSFTMPGVGFLAAGPLVAAFTGGGAGALTGGLLGGLIGLGMPEHEAKLYERELKDGAILIAVTARSDAQYDQAKTILKRNDATHLAA